MVSSQPSTIFALSSGAPPSGIAVIRVSGPQARTVVGRLAGSVPEARRATFRSFRDGADALIDQGLLLWFPGPGTATGEDLAEFHVHGGRAVVARMIAVLGDLPGVRSAEAGEFTRRAFLNGRIDLLEAEALGDLLAAETEQQRRAAMAVAEGALGRMIEPWRAKVVGLAALVEASLDFGDEDDVTAATFDIGAEARSLADDMSGLLAAPPVERLRDGISVVLAGPPNAGKSSLLNRLTGRDAAIVSSLAGTTRDVIEVPMTIGGTAFVLSDTAGLREQADVIEQMGIERARRRIDQADLLLWLGEEPPPVHPHRLWIAPKADLRTASELGAHRIAVSVATGEGVDDVLAWLMRSATDLLPKNDQLALSLRQRGELENAKSALVEGAGEDDLVLRAEALRSARMAFDRLTGKAGFEDLLDTVFGQFCLGK